MVSLHVPSTTETRNLINAENLDVMRDGSFLINTARGDLVDDAAVLAVLDSGKLPGIGFDVVRGEPDTSPLAISADTDTLRSAVLILKVCRFARLALLGSWGVRFEKHNAKNYEEESQHLSQ